jgi:hypothetical protein
MPVKYFAPKVTNYVSLIFPPRDNRGQNDEQPHHVTYSFINMLFISTGIFVYHSINNTIP